MDYTKLEKFSKRMEFWHNRFYKWGAVAFTIYITSVIPINDWYSFGSIIAVGAFVCYSILFTTFQFPIKFGGRGKGIKLGPMK